MLMLLTTYYAYNYGDKLCVSLERGPGHTCKLSGGLVTLANFLVCAESVGNQYVSTINM